MPENSNLNEIRATIFKVQGFLEFIRNIIAYEELFQERPDFQEMLNEIEQFLINKLKELLELEELEQAKINQSQYGDD